MFLQFFRDSNESIQSKKCDISTWYSKAVSERLFEGQLDTKQKKTHETIKNILSTGKTRQVDCSILLAFESDLKNSVLKRHTSGLNKTKANASPPSTESKQAVESTEKQAAPVSIQIKDNAEKPSATESNNQKTNIAGHSAQATKETNDRDGYPEEDVKSTERNVDTSETKPGKDITFRNKENDIQMKTDNEIDETELDDTEEDDASDTSDLNMGDEKHREENEIHEYENSNDLSPEPNAVYTDKTKESKLQSIADVFNPKNNKIGDSVNNDERTCQKYTWEYQTHLALKTSPAKASVCQSKVPVGYSCTNTYAISPIFCLSKSENNAIKIIHNVTSPAENKNRAEENHVLFRTSEFPKKTETFNPDAKEEQKEKEDMENVNHSSNERNLKNIKQDLLKHIEKYVDEDERISSGNYVKTQRSDSLKQTIDLEQVKSIVSVKTEEYIEKMRFLELNIVKLENQMLVEKLNKENHSSTIARLENNILRLENELLRMKQSFHHMKIDNDEIRKTQRKYLELGHSSQSSSLQRHNQEEMLLTQQKTIGMLSEKLQNQSSEITRLRNKSEYIEDQNRMLHSLIMNQTTLVSQMMTTVQELTEKSFKQQEITKEMKEQISTGLADVKALKESKGNYESTDKGISDSKHPSTEDISHQLLQQLDDLVSDKMLETGESVDATTPSVETKDKEDEIDEQLKQYLQYTSVFYFVKPDQWCHSLRFCYKGVIILSECVPFSPITYHKCEVSNELQYSEIKTLKLKTEKDDKTNRVNSLKPAHELDPNKNVKPLIPNDGSQFDKKESLSNVNSDEENVPTHRDKEGVADFYRLDQEGVKKNMESTHTKILKELDQGVHGMKDEISAKASAQESTKSASTTNTIANKDSKTEREPDETGTEDQNKVIVTEKISKEREEDKEAKLTSTPGENNSTVDKRPPVKYASNGQSDPKGLYRLANLFANNCIIDIN